MPLHSTIKQKKWPTRNSYVPGLKKHSRYGIPLVNHDKLLMLPLLIKLGLMKNFVKPITKNSLNGFEFICKNFPN